MGLQRTSWIAALLAAAGLFAYAVSAETPVGSVKGRVLAEDTGQPLAGIRVIVAPTKPKDGSDSYNLKTGADGTFALDRVPIGPYSVETATQVYTAKAQKLEVKEGEATELAINLKPGDPFLRMDVHQRAYLPENNPRIGLNGFRQGDDVRLRLFAVNGEALTRSYGGDLRRLLTPVASDNAAASAILKRGGVKMVREWKHPVRKRDAEGVFYEYERLGTLPPGIYLVEADGEKNTSLGWLMVTDLALVTKTAGGRVLAFTVDLKTGRPVPGARVTAFRNSAAVARATTDARGAADLRLGGSDDDVDAVALRGDSVAFMRVWMSDRGNDPYRVFAYTDRPVYRPGHTVRFKGVVRRPEGIGYAVPSSRTVRVEARDWQDTVVYQDELSLNDHGSFAGRFDLPKEAQGGAYSLRTSLDGRNYEGSFSVASYRKPEWQVDVTFGKPAYIRGERVPVTISAHYYYGAPVVEGKVRYTVYRSQRWSWWGDEEYAGPDEGEEGYADTSGDVVAEGELVTDQGGAARFEFNTALTANEDRSAEYDYNVEAEVSDLSERLASGSGSVVVSAGEWSLDAQPERYVGQPGAPLPVVVRVRDMQDKPVAAVTLTATAALEIWDGKSSRQEALPSGSVTTDNRGVARFTTQSPRPGLVVVKFAATDRRGNRIEASTDVWVSTVEGGDYGRRYSALSLIPDKKLYKIGDTAQVLVNTDRPGSMAIVAIEAERVIEYRQVVLKSKSTVVRLPVRAGYEPNVFVTACFVRDGEFSNSHARLNVSADQHRLKVTIESDRKTLHPGDTVTYTIRTTSVSGRPVPAEVSFGVVDEAIYAIREDEKDAMWKAFYPRRHNAVNTEFSYPHVYLGDASKDGANVAVRKKFPDTAYWDPFLRTDASGTATVRVQLPDSLTSWRATAIACTAKTEVGQARQNVEVMRELTVRLQTPRSFTEGDRLTLTAVAHNHSPGPLDVALTLQAPGLQLQGDARRSVRIDPGKAQSVAWEAVAAQVGSVTVTVTGSGGRYQDGMQVSVPVLPFARESVHYQTGALTGASAVETFERDAEAVDGEMELRLAPTLAGTILGSLDYLATYPYGCTEQTTSSFLPDVLLTRTLRDLNLERPTLQAKLPDMVRSGLLRLYSFQQDEGAWGWWEHGEADPWMTSYVLFALAQARAAGFAVNPRVYDNGLNAAAELAANDEVSPDDLAFLAYSLALAKRMEPLRPLLVRLDKKYGELQVRSIGYRALALAATGNAADREKAKASLNYLWSRADSSGGLVHWNERKPKSGYYVPQSAESTAVVLKAALALTPEDPRLAGIVRWLLLQRRGNQWMSTRDTAWILFALTDYLKATGELKPDYHLSVLLNGKEIHAEDVSPGDALRGEVTVRVPLRDLEATDRLELRKEGGGTVYYSLRVTQKIRAASFAPESPVPGLTLERQYFQVETRRDAAGRLVVGAAKNPTTSARVGDRLLVRLKIRTKAPLQYVMLEDPLPSGWEVQERGEVDRADWDYRWEHMEVRDDRVAVFFSSLEPGEHLIEYHLRPELAGAVRALPAVLSDMYNPAVRATTAEGRLAVGK